MPEHPTLYFSDGNVVIVCRNNEGTPTYFRIHQTIMARHSPIFADMLTLPLPPDNQDVYDGVPFVEFPDDPEEMVTFLRFFYEPFASPISLNTDPDFAVNISGVLKMADRLMVEPLKQAIINRIRLDWQWPSTLDEWDARRSFYPAHGKSGYYPDPAHVIQIARLYDSSLLVPSLFYELSSRDPGNGTRWDLVSEKDRMTAFAGRKRMLDWLLDSFMDWTLDMIWKCSKSSTDCTEFQLRRFIVTHRSLISSGEILGALECSIWKDGEWNPQLEEEIDDTSCRCCGLESDARWKELRNDLFECLPRFYTNIL